MFVSLLLHYLWLFSELPAIDTSFPRNKTVLEGHQFTLLCLPLGNVFKVNVTWIKKGISDSSSPVSAVNLTMNATRYDIGEYYCVVTNGVESIASPTAYVDVLCKYGIRKMHPPLQLTRLLLGTTTTTTTTIYLYPERTGIEPNRVESNQGQESNL